MGGEDPGWTAEIVCHPPKMAPEEEDSKANRKPRRSGASPVSGNYPSHTGCSARSCCSSWRGSDCPSQTRPRRYPACCGRSGCRRQSCSGAWPSRRNTGPSRPRFLIDNPLRQDGAANPSEQEDPKEGRYLMGCHPRTIFRDAQAADHSLPTSVRREKQVALVPPSSFALAKVAGTPGTTSEAALAGKKIKDPTQQSMPPAKRRMCPCILECFGRRKPYSSPEAWWPEGSEPRSRRRAGSRPASSRGDLSARDECSMLP